MCRILHIVDDEKFTDTIFNTFESVNPDKNKFIIISNKKTCNYVKKTPVSIVPTRAVYLGGLKELFFNYDIVVIHMMNDLKLLLISQAPKYTRFVWCGWGADYYDLITQGEEITLLKPKTRLLFNWQMQEQKRSFSTRSKQLAKKLLGYNVDKIKVINSRISFFAPVIYEDYELIKKSMPDFRPQFVSWNNGSLEDDSINEYINSMVSGNNILVGNSSSYTNNHIEAFDLIYKYKLDGRDIITPLSYGDEFYREKIIAHGTKLFGANFIPLITFLTLDRYIALLKSCSIVIMNHLRQQAVGNIIMMLHMGAKVFLDHNNPVYNHFKKQGASIFTLEDLEHEADLRLTMPQIVRNRKILKNNWSKEVINKKTKNMIDTVMSSPRNA